ncbi:hypothetical protein CDL12_17359 [Handroanthus impetiginosus]|uniref:Uncharacterized protein n=1 Tax=Handroanthus impetiginosus TaxID=429701 RepID=A0A2G9GXP4_9LAMI|nr:hypothetical protein CDL12_17359 [Handroanthus impetiginosus]
MAPHAWLLILLCAHNFLSTLALENPLHLKNKDLFISSKERQLLDPQDHDFGTRKFMASEDITSTEKPQRGGGRGSTGGANVVHRRPPDRNGALLYRPYFLSLHTFLGFSFSLLLAFPFRLS